MQGYRGCLKNKNPATYSINKVWFKCPAPVETLLWRRLDCCGSGFSSATQTPCISRAPEAVVPSSFNPAETGCLMELHSRPHFLPHLTRTFSFSNWTLFRELMFFHLCICKRIRFWQCQKTNSWEMNWKWSSGLQINKVQSLWFLWTQQVSGFANGNQH